MTTTQTDGEASPIVSVLRSMRWFDGILFSALIVTQSFIFYLVLSDREQARTDRALNEQRHAEVMRSIRSVVPTMIQSVKVESSREDMVRKLLKLEDPK
jgi:sensor domain CHASE-containing protein